MTVEQIISDLVAREGGYVDHPADRGGPTKHGISLDTLRGWRERPVTDRDVQALTVDEAREIYHRRFVRAPGFDTLPAGPVRTQLVDDAALSGPRRAILDLQEALGVRRDGVLGPVTRAAVAAAEPTRLNTQLVRVRTERLVAVAVSNPPQLVFLRGWVRRALGFLRP